ncbi:class I SAM-dependent methyltransferase [Aliivibrio fischeri]|uniref:Methyltransferase n=1 Tax=Aliivibrio fischeri SR5 TaxID=1088719 RepID=A0AAV3ENX5_ALIFS|nr:class I SAM-dependent methyltransferase [Aliivibrio fischeri]EHN68651.1 methyltransferase [Aliivibrio fischeri SR5]
MYYKVIIAQSLKNAVYADIFHSIVTNSGCSAKVSNTTQINCIKTQVQVSSMNNTVQNIYEKDLTQISSAVSTTNSSLDKHSINISAYIQQPSKVESKAETFTEMLPLYLPILISAGTLIFVIYKHGQDLLENRARKEQEELENRIKKFLAPLKELREESKLLYEIFAVELKKEYFEEHKEHFRTIRFLCDHGKDKLTPADSAILDEIIAVSRANITLIEAEVGSVNSPALSNLLGKLCAHFRAMELASKQKLAGCSEKLEALVFPLEIDGAIENEIRYVNECLEELKEPKKKKKWRNIMKSKSGTIKYYDTHAESYYLQTNHIDMSSSYDRFRRLIPRHCHILDAGCGVGRDTRYFMSKGYKVYSFDLSDKMVEITKKYPFAFCKKMAFSEVDFYEEFDAIWANASLLHVPKKELKDVMTRLLKSLKINGHMYASFKTPKNFIPRDNRDFIFHTEAELHELMVDTLNMELIESWEQHKNNNPANESFMNYIWKRCV